MGVGVRFRVSGSGFGGVAFRGLGVQGFGVSELRLSFQDLGCRI